MELPKGIFLILSVTIFVLLALLFYCLSLGLVNIKIETEFLGKGSIPAWPKPLAKVTKFIFEQIVELTLLIIGLIAEATKIMCKVSKVIYKEVLTPIGQIVKITSKHCIKLFKRKFNACLVELQVVIAKGYMTNGGWE